MSLDDERVRFYFRHREQIEQWAALRSEAAAAVDEWMTQLAPDIEDLAKSLGPDVKLRVWTGADQAYPSYRLTRATWGFGDARCTVDLKLARATIVSAIKDPKATLAFPDHTVKCVIEGEKEPTNVTATLAPKAEFVDGKVSKVWVNLKQVAFFCTLGGANGDQALADLRAACGLEHRDCGRKHKESADRYAEAEQD